MAEQEQKRKRSEGPPGDENVSSRGRVSEKGKKLKAEMDRLVDEIDDVLEENAEEFVRSYVQRGGE
jgi:ubiquitin-like protein Pup